MKKTEKVTKADIKKKNLKRRRWNRDDTELTLLAAPTVVWYLLFSYLPMFGLILAFKNYKISAGKSFLYSLLHSEWNGLDNFQFFLKSNQLAVILRHTVLYNAAFIILNIVIPVGLAIMISQIYSRRKSKVYQTLMFMPHFMSWVVVSYFVFAFLSPDKGFLNAILGALGKEPVMWYSEARFWPFILIFMQTWKSVGYNMVVYLASISGIDSTLYEAAVMDGASKRQQARYITLPSLKPIIIIMFILSVGRIFSSDFGLFYQIPRGVTNSLYKVVTTFDVYIFNMLQSNVPLGRTAAASFFQAVACCITILAANQVVKKIDSDSALI